MIDNIVVKVPATSANMGPGFDSLGIALDVWNEVRISKGSFSIKIDGTGEEELPKDPSNLVYKSFCKVLHTFFAFSVSSKSVYINILRILINFFVVT